MGAVIFVPELAHRFGKTVAEYWQDAANRFRAEAAAAPAGSLAAVQATELTAFCTYRWACAAGRPDREVNRLAKVLRAAEDATRTAAQAQGAA